jgi:argininosuccinate synthase
MEARATTSVRALGTRAIARLEPAHPVEDEERAEDKVVLAYSGGLDTACILKVLLQRGYEVIAYVADVGQQEDFDESPNAPGRRARAKVVVEDLKREFVTDFIFPAIAGNAIYENRYLLGTSLARPVIARGRWRSRWRRARSISRTAPRGRGTTRSASSSRSPRSAAAEVVAPWKEREFLERFRGRSDLIAFAREHRIPVEATAEKPYSSDENLMHRSYEAGFWRTR